MSKAFAPLPTSKAKTAYGLLSEVCRVILDEPKRYNQETYLLRNEDGPACGTVGCVAGWVALLTRPDQCGWFNSASLAADALGINFDQARVLFDGGALSKTSANPQTKAYAKAGVAHIRRFQKAYAKQLKAKAVTR